MGISIAWRIAAAFLVALASLVIIASVSYRNLYALNRDAQWVTHTFEVLAAKEQLVRAIADMQGAGRAYALTADPKFRDEVSQTTGKAISLRRKLRQLTADNPDQQQRLDQLDGLLQQRTDLTQRLILQRDAAPGAVTPLFAATVLQAANVADTLTGLADEIERHERDLLAVRFAAAERTEQRTKATLIYGSAAAFLFGVFVAGWVMRSIRAPLRGLVSSAGKLARGEYEHRVATITRDEIGAMATAFNEMAAQIEQRQVALAAEAWLKSGLARMSHVFEGQRDLRGLAASALSETAQLLNVQHGALYLPSRDKEHQRLLLYGTYAASDAPAVVEPGERLIGQAFVERRRIQVDALPASYVRIGSALGGAPAHHLLVFPAVMNGEVRAVIELASFAAFTEIQLRFLQEFADMLALVINTVVASNRTDELLKESQRLSASLEVQSAEIASRNDELEIQAQRLQASEELLQQQQEELKQSNEELQQTNEELQQANEEMEERQKMLSEQKRLLEQSNLEIESARMALQEKSEQLALTSKYKSEFLANMSHELRTPLNSLLILSKMLADNGEGTLTDKQVTHARTIYASGNDLLRLIDDILDLSKVEAGAIDLEIEETPVATLRDSLEALFKPIAQSRNLKFAVHLDPGLPAALDTDGRRLQQILKNLLANAFKFTQRGSVELSIYPAKDGWDPSLPKLAQAKQVIAFAVKDSGIGIPEDRQKIIFEAFQQAEAGTARKYGGTGLGLSISRELAALLGGGITLQSEAARGSTFTLFIPDKVQQRSAPESSIKVQFMPRLAASAAPPTAEAPAQVELQQQPELIADDRRSLVEGDAVLLIIEDDRHFAYVLSECGRENNFKVVVAGTAAAGIALARSIKPSAITLDLHLPDGNGYVVLDLLKHDPGTRHIPVHVISVAEDRERSLKQGAVSFLHKPVTREALDQALSVAAQYAARARRLLVVEDDPVQQDMIREVVGDGDVDITVVGSAAAALEKLGGGSFDCLVLDLGLPDQSGVDLIREIHRRHGLNSPPVVVYTAKALTRREETELRGLSDAIVVKDVRSPERLLDETALFLHRVQAKLPESKRRMLERIQREDSALSGRKVLVVDDDLRNIFAISTALENYKMAVAYAESGQEALDKLQQEDGFSAILMDVMMPEMDGFEATRRIRAMPRYNQLPIIMVTAKAMRGDREKCLQAGASDYITKPVDMDQLRSLLRVWLYH
jgi:CheY-like chemotaxis protein/CHASE3 domain sensor protein